MDKQLIERIALEVAKDYLKFKLGDRKGLDIYDLDLDDEDLKQLIAEIERECADSFMQFLTRIDAERGKEVVAKVLVHYNYGPDYKASVEWLTDYRLAPDTPLFLSPTIPEGMVMVPIEPTEEILDAMANTARAMPDDGDLVIQYNAMLAAAQGEK